MGINMESKMNKYIVFTFICNDCESEDVKKISKSEIECNKCGYVGDLQESCRYYYE